MNEEQILEKVESLTAKQLCGFIKDGTTTLDQLRRTELLDASKRKEIQKLLDADELKEKEEWNGVKDGDINSLKNFISDYPNGKYLFEANNRIKKLQKDIDEANSEKNEILNNLKRDANKYTPKDLKDFIKGGTITKDEIIDCGIPNYIVNKLDNISIPNLKLGATPESIPEGYTEVYFWGIPGSGKTTALSAILSTAQRNGELVLAKGPGLNYATRLKNVFNGDVGFLPAPSPVDSTQYIPFTLKKENEKTSRSVSLIELSGEIFQCFYHFNAGTMDDLSVDHNTTFNTLGNFLESKNRKIHFFFIDYEKESMVDVNDITQSDYLEAAATYFDNNDVFNSTTDAIYIVITKSDLMDCEPKERKDYIKKYLNNNNFKAFVNSLKNICGKYSINGGKLKAIPFSLGDVYFKQLCEVDRAPSNKIICVLHNRINPTKESILDQLNR